MAFKRRKDTATGSAKRPRLGRGGSRDPFEHLQEEREKLEEGEEPWFLAEDDDAAELRVEAGISSNLSDADLADLADPTGSDPPTPRTDEPSPLVPDAGASVFDSPPPVPANQFDTAGDHTPDPPPPPPSPPPTPDDAGTTSDFDPPPPNRAGTTSVFDPPLPSQGHDRASGLEGELPPPDEAAAYLAAPGPDRVDAEPQRAEIDETAEPGRHRRQGATPDVIAGTVAPVDAPAPYHLAPPDPADALAPIFDLPDEGPEPNGAPEPQRPPKPQRPPDHPPSSLDLPGSPSSAGPPGSFDQPSSLDQPGSPGSFDQPSSLDQPGSPSSAGPPETVEPHWPDQLSEPQHLAEQPPIRAGQEPAPVEPAAPSQDQHLNVPDWPIDPPPDDRLEGDLEGRTEFGRPSTPAPTAETPATTVPSESPPGEQPTSPPTATESAAPLERTLVQAFRDVVAHAPPAPPEDPDLPGPEPRQPARSPEQPQHRGNRQRVEPRKPHRPPRRPQGF